MKREPGNGIGAWGAHVADGSDARGDALPITIRIGPDGRVYFHDITEGLVSVALAMNPGDASMHDRLRVLAAFDRGGQH